MVLLIEIFFIVILTVTLTSLYLEERRLRIRFTPHVKFEEYWDADERRKSVRVNSECDVTYQVDRKPHAKIDTLTRDLSTGGVRFLAQEKLPVGTRLKLHIQISKTEAPIKAVGEVMWVNGESSSMDNEGRRVFNIGVKFLRLSKQDESKLIGYLKSCITPYVKEA